VPHCDPESLSLAALGEPVPPVHAEHLRDCRTCRDELAALVEVVQAVRAPARLSQAHVDHAQLEEMLDDVPRMTPPPAVWQRIVAETGIAAGTPDPFAARQEPIDTTTDPIATTPAAAVIPLGRARRAPSRWSRLAVATTVAAGVAAMVGGLAGAGAMRWWDSRSPATAPAATVVARTDLASLPDTPVTTGIAQVITVGATRELRVDVSALPPVKGFREVWLIDPSITRMIPIGVLDSTRATFALPPGLTLTDYPIVDVSVEPMDGNPAHSGTSILRGTIHS
jgi:Anti-sigma-K factor rskA